MIEKQNAMIEKQNEMIEKQDNLLQVDSPNMPALAHHLVPDERNVRVLELNLWNSFKSEECKQLPVHSVLCEGPVDVLGLVMA